MDPILSAPKPANVDDWLRDVESQQAFHDALAHYLAQSLAYQAIGVSRADAEAFVDAGLRQASHRDEVWTDSLTPPLDASEDEDTASQIDLYALDINFARGQSPLMIRGVHFPAHDERLGFDYTALLRLFPALYFIDCRFTCEPLPLGYGSYSRFEDCTFDLPWRIDEGSGPGQDHVLFDACCFEQGVTILGDELGQAPINAAQAFFRDCTIRVGLQLRNMATDIPVFAHHDETLKAHKAEIDRIEVKNCEIGGRFTLDNTFPLAEVSLTSTVFRDKFALIHCPVDRFSAKNTNFDGLVDFYQSSFESFLMRKSICRDFAGFEDCCFGEMGKPDGRITLRYVTFYSFANFRSAAFHLPLDLRSTNRREPPNFLDATFRRHARKSTDRETFRIIKHSFEAVGNRIEANTYFAYEMEAYRRELREMARRDGRHRRYWERLLITLNFVLSRHGQSYWQPLLWVLTCGAIVALQQANWQHGWLTWPEAAADVVTPLAATLNAWASGMVIFRPLYAAFPGREAFILLMAVLLSTCLWHFLVAARRHHRH